MAAIPTNRWRERSRAGKVDPEFPAILRGGHPVERGAAAGRRSQPRRPVHDGGGGADSASQRLGQVPRRDLSGARGRVGALCRPFHLHAAVLPAAARHPDPRLLAAGAAARSTLLCISTVIFVTGLPYVPLATASAISFTGPFIVTALAPLVLGERVGPKRSAAVAIGFVGALVIVRPGAAGMNTAALLFFGSAFFSAMYQLLTRKLAAHDSAETSITYIALAGFVLTTIPLPFVWKTPVSWHDALLFFGLGLFGGFGHYFIVRAYEIAAPFVSPFNYLQ